MTYSIGAAAEMLGVAPSTIRYYDKEGLLPNIGRNAGGLRVFEQHDIESLRMIECLKRTGMSIKDIGRFMEWCGQGDETLEERLNMFHERKAAVEEQMARLQDTLEVIEYKCWYYETAMAAGTEQAPRTMPLDKMPADIRALKEKHFPSSGKADASADVA